MKKLADPLSTSFSPVEDKTTGKGILFHQSTGNNRPFITSNGLMGLASSRIQKGDLLYGFNSLEDLFLGTQSMYLIIRPGTHHLVYSFTLIGRAIMLPVPEEKYCSFSSRHSKRRTGKYSDFSFRDDLIAEGTFFHYCEERNC
jgi:hypothetical protein